MKYSELTIKEILDILVGDDDKKKKEVKEVLRKLKKEIEEDAWLIKN